MIDISHPEQRRLFLKAKTRALIAEFGVEAAAEITGRGTSTVSRWQHPDTGDSIPADCLLLLEVACGKPVLSSAMARMQPANATESAGAPAGAPAAACAHEDCTEKFSELAALANGLNTHLAITISDGVVSKTECHQALKLIADTRRSMDKMERSLIKATGSTGPKAVTTGEAG